MSADLLVGSHQIIRTLEGQCSEIELSIVIPCLNEVETVANCVRKAACWLESRAIRGEIIVADNGSTDGSVESSERAGARIVHVAEKGYGGALIGGIERSYGKYIIMGDADDSYDFSHLDGFMEKLRGGYDLVQGCRLPGGGGEVMADAMPLLHRRLGNPLFSFLAQSWFGAPIHDVYCGLRGFCRSFYTQLNMQCTGMEFAVEMIIKASLMKARIGEVPIILHPDGRVTRKPHLRTFRDGWRTLRFFLLYSPKWLFLVPGIVLMIVGLAASLVLLTGTVFIGTIGFDFHTLVFSAALIVIGFNATAFAVLSRVFASRVGLLPDKRSVQYIDRFFNLEIGLMVSGAMLALGVAIAVFSFWQWSLTNFGPLHSFVYVRLVVCSATLLILGSQLTFGVFFMGMLNLRRRFD
jgi:glycosyltransferase involved in cell wall biosynthesis